MFHDHQDALEGPHFDAGLVGASGRLTRLHKGGGGYKGPSKSEIAAQKKQDEMFMKMMAQSSKKIEMPQMPVIPPAPKPEPVPPPPSQSSADVEDAKAEAKRSAAKRYGLLRTTYAGATGGYGGTPLGAGGGGRSLLG